MVINIKKIYILLIVIAIFLSATICFQLNTYADTGWPAEYPEQPYDATVTNWIIYTSSYDGSTILYRAGGPMFIAREDGGYIVNTNAFIMGKMVFHYVNGNWVERTSKVVECKKIAGPGSIIATNQQYVYLSDNYNWEPLIDTEVFYSSSTPLDELNTTTNLTDFTEILMNNKTYFGLDNEYIGNYSRYTAMRKSRINEAMYANKPYTSQSAVSSKFTALCKPIYKLVAMPTDTTEIFVKNSNMVGSATISIDFYKADYRSTWTYSSGAKDISVSNDITDHDDMWEYDAGESELIELLNPIEGKIAIRYEQDIGLFVVFSSYEDGGNSDTPTDPTQPIEEIKMPQAPNRANYEDNVWGSINYSLDCILYWVGYPFIALNYLSSRFVLYMQTLMNNIGAMNNVMKSAVSWLPPEFIAILLLGVITAVILKILGR